MTADHESRFWSMGCEVRLLIGPRSGDGLAPAQDAAAQQRTFIEGFAQRLSRFEPASELSALNRHRAVESPASPLLRAAVRAGVWAARETDGLVDPTLVRALEAIGYARSLDGSRPAPLGDAIAAAPPRRPAQPHPARRWAQIEVDDRAGVIRRPVGLAIDTGGTGKGLAADAVAYRLRDHRRYAIDCGGDVAIGGRDALAHPYEVEVEHPLTGEVVETLLVAAGGVATSGLNVRVWRCQDGSFAHHLLDPATAQPAWTGVVGATAVGPSALEAETLSKAALLSGPAGARRILARHGGLIVHDDGDVEPVGRLPVRPRLRVRLPTAPPVGSRAA